MLIALNKLIEIQSIRKGCFSLYPLGRSCGMLAEDQIQALALGQISSWARGRCSERHPVS